MTNEELGIRTMEDVERHKRAHADASVCCRCGAAIPPGSPIWMLPCRVFVLYDCVAITEDTWASGCEACDREAEARNQEHQKKSGEVHLYWSPWDNWWPLRSGNCPACGRV